MRRPGTVVFTSAAGRLSYTCAAGRNVMIVGLVIISKSLVLSVSVIIHYFKIHFIIHDVIMK